MLSRLLYRALPVLLRSVLVTAYAFRLGMLIFFGGSGEIRTHGAIKPDGIQSRCLKPDSATLPKRERYSTRAFAYAPSIDSLLIPCIAICVIQTTPRGGCYYRSPYFLFYSNPDVIVLTT